MSDFDRRFEALRRELESKQAWERTYAFQALHLEWADAVKASEPETALAQYKLAEDCQCVIGGYATSGGEGLASMTELYGIMGKRADVLERLNRLDEALQVWESILRDPNGLAELTPAAAKVRALKTKLGR